MARKTGYNKEYLKLVDKYLRVRKDRLKKVLKQKNGERGYLIYETIREVRLPTIEDFAVYIGRSRKTVYNWEEKHKDFAKALDKIRLEQKIRVINNGLAGFYNPAIAKLILTTNHGMRDRIDATTGDKPIENNNFNDEQINRIAERIIEKRARAIASDSSGTEELD